MSRNATKPSPVPRDSEPDTESERSEQVEQQGNEESTHEEAAPAEASARQGRARRLLRRVARPGVLLRLLLVCALCAGSAILGIQVYQDNALQQARGSAVKAARDYAVALTSYDHKTLADDFNKVSSNATGEFGKEYQQVSAKLTKLIKKNKAVSKGNVRTAGLVSGDRHRAVVLLFVDQTITNTNIDKPRIDRNRMRMTLLHKKDHWLIDNVELL